MKGDIVCKLNEELALVREQLRQSEAARAKMHQTMIFLRDEIDYESNEESARAVRAITLALGSDAGQSLLDRLEEARVLLSSIVQPSALLVTKFNTTEEWLTRRDILLAKMGGGR